MPTKTNQSSLKRKSWPLAAAVTAGLLAVSPARAEISYSGAISPADPATWTTSNATVGNSGIGSLTLDGGSVLQTRSVIIGAYTSTAFGTVTVDGAGTLWQLNPNPLFPSAASSLTVGSVGTGILNITNGGTVVSGTGAIAGTDGSVAIVHVDGAGSAWNVGGLLQSLRGNTDLLITNGGTVTAGSVSMSSVSAPKSTFTINGAGSKLAVSGVFNPAASSSSGTPPGNVYIADGGSLTAGSLSVGFRAPVPANISLDVGNGSSLIVGGGSGAISDNGRLNINLVAGAGAASGTYAPVQYGSGAPNVQAFGGVWDSASRTVTVSDAVTAQAGETASLELSSVQRLLFTDAASGESAGLSFQGSNDPVTVDFSASLTGSADVASLQSLLEAGDNVLSAWDFTPGQGYYSGNPVYVSLGIGSGFNVTDLAIWHFDGAAWSLFDAPGLAYNGQFASFTASDFSSYAVTGFAAPVPVPAAVWLFGSALAGFGVFGRRRSVAH